MRKVLVLALVLGVIAAVDISARALAERKIEERAAAGLGVSAVQAEIRSVPFLPRILLTNRVSTVRFELDQVPAGSLTFPSVVVELYGVEVDGDRLRSEREVELVDIERGRVAMDLSQQMLSDTLRQQVRIAGGQVQVSIAGRLVTATPSVRDGSLVLQAGSLPDLVLPIPRTDVIPCVASVTVLAGRLRVTCALDEIPPALIRAVNAAA